MRTKVSVALDGAELHAVDESIILQGISETPNWNITGVTRGTQIGQAITGFEKRLMDFQISFVIDEKDPRRRMDVLQKVSAWAAGGGWMTVSYRERQRIRVFCSALPVIQGVEKYGSVYTLTLRAAALPMWEDIEGTGVVVTGSDATATLRISATGGGKFRFWAENSSGSTCNLLQVAANGKAIRMENLGLESGERIEMDYTDDDIQSFLIRNTSMVYRSVLAKRSITSADDIMLVSGENTIGATSDVSLTWGLWTKGRWIR